jgi:hypothetical protein
MDTVDAVERRVLLGAEYSDAVAAAARRDGGVGGAPPAPRALRAPPTVDRDAGRAPMALRQPKPSNSRVLDAPLHPHETVRRVGGGGTTKMGGTAARPADHRSPGGTHTGFSTPGPAATVPRLSLPALTPALEPTPVAEAAAVAAGGGVRPTERIGALYSSRAGVLSPRTFACLERAAASTSRSEARARAESRAAADSDAAPVVTTLMEESRRGVQEKLLAMAGASGVILSGPQRPASARSAYGASSRRAASSARRSKTPTAWGERPPTANAAVPSMEQVEREAAAAAAAAAAPPPGQTRGGVTVEYAMPRPRSPPRTRDLPDFTELQEGDFPMFAFDSDEFEQHSDPLEWVKLGQADGGTRATSPRFVGPIATRHWEYVACVVTGYDPASSRFQIRFVDGAVKSVWRIALKFDVEPDWLFAARREYALSEREKAKESVRYRVYLESLPDSGESSIRKEILDKIVARATTNGALPEELKTTAERVLLEVARDYALRDKDVVVRYELLNPAARARHATLRMAAPTFVCRRTVGHIVPTGAAAGAFAAARAALGQEHATQIAPCWPSMLQLVSAWHRTLESCFFVDVRVPASAQYAISVNDAAVAEAKAKRLRRQRVARQLALLRGAGAALSLDGALAGPGGDDADARLPCTVRTWIAVQATHAADLGVEMESVRGDVIASLVGTLHGGAHASTVADLGVYASSGTRRLLKHIGLLMGGLVANVVDASFVALLRSLRSYCVTPAARDAIDAVLTAAPRGDVQGDEVLAALRSAVETCRARADAARAPIMVVAPAPAVVAAGPGAPTQQRVHAGPGPAAAGAAQTIHGVPRALPPLFVVVLSASAAGVSFVTTAGDIAAAVRTVISGVLATAGCLKEFETEYMAALSLEESMLLPLRSASAVQSPPPALGTAEAEGYCHRVAFIEARAAAACEGVAVAAQSEFLAGPLELARAYAGWCWLIARSPEDLTADLARDIARTCAVADSILGDTGSGVLYGGPVLPVGGSSTGSSKAAVPGVTTATDSGMSGGGARRAAAAAHAHTSPVGGGPRRLSGAAAASVTPSSGPLLDERVEISRYFGAIKAITEISADVVPEGLVAVDCTEMRRGLVSAARTLTDSAVAAVVNDCVAITRKIESSFERLLARSLEKPSDVDGLDTLRRFTCNVGACVALLSAAVTETLGRLEALGGFLAHVDPVVLQAALRLRLFPPRIDVAQRECLAHLEVLTRDLVIVLEEDREVFERTLRTFPGVVNAFSGYGDIAETDVRAIEASRQLDRFDIAVQTVNDFRRRESIFGIAESAYLELWDSMNQFQPLGRVWLISSEFKVASSRWMTAPFRSLDAAGIQSQVEAWYKEAVGLLRALRDTPSPLHVCRELVQLIKTFRDLLPVIGALANTALRESHWDEISGIVGVRLVLDDSLTLAKFVELNFAARLEEIEAVSYVASKEAAVATELTSLEHVWESTRVDLRTDTDTGSYIVADWSKLLSLLDTQLIQTHKLLSSHYVAPSLAKCLAFENWLRGALSFVERWQACQQDWMVCVEHLSSCAVPRAS